MELRVTFRTDRPTATRIKELIPSAVLGRGGCEIVVKGDGPTAVAERVRDIFEKVRSVFDSPERL